MHTGTQALYRGWQSSCAKDCLPCTCNLIRLRLPDPAAALVCSSDLARSRQHPMAQCPEHPGCGCRAAQPQEGCLAGGSAPLAHGGPASQHSQATARSFILSSLKLGATTAGRGAGPRQPLCRPCCPGQEIPASGGAGDLAQPGAPQGAWRAFSWSPACQPAPGAALRHGVCTERASGRCGTTGMHALSDPRRWSYPLAGTSREA